MNIRRFITTAVVCATTLIMVGCDAQSDATASDTDAKKTIITAYDVEPQNPLTPGDSGESAGIRVSDQIYSGLVTYDENGSINNEMAKSITANSDSTRFTITIKDGWTFTDHTPVTAQSFTKAWSYAAVGSNGMKNAWCFSSIKGYEALQDANTASDAQLSGLTIVDHHTFTVDMNAPNAVFPIQLGYIAFAPMPEAAYANMKQFGESPITNGPYKLKKWEHSKSITLVKNPDYRGKRTPKNGGITFQLYTKNDAAYSDVQAGNLDVLDDIPSSALKTFQSDSSLKAVNTAGSAFQGFTIPVQLSHFKMDDEGRLRRKALSLAIDRNLITTKIFEGTRTPATDFLAPPIAGHSKSLTGSDVLNHNADKAKKLWRQADDISPFTGTFEIAYNSDAGHKPWIDAVCNQIKNALGIQAQGKAFPTAAEYYDTLDAATPTFAFYTSWGADWPSAQNFLVTLYDSSSADGKGSNTGNYKNPDFDALMDKAAASASIDDANSYYQQGEEILLTDLPTIPLWYGNATAVTGTEISGLKFNFNKIPLYWSIAKG